MKKTRYKDGAEINTENNIFTDESILLMYATDASAYREKPKGVVWPEKASEIKKLISESVRKGWTIIPRGAGTSLAGQVVGNGLVVDISRHMNRILELNAEEKWVRLEPGVVLDELNKYLAEYHLFFGPETSTSNRCVIGGMVGNNSSGLHSLVYGTTREHLISLKCILSDGSDAEFKALSPEEFRQKLESGSLEGKLYRQIDSILSEEKNRDLIREEFPDSSVVRRNTGYALDELMDCRIYNPSSEKDFNFCRILAGSEGTLAFTTEIKLSLVDLPPSEKALLCVHLSSVKEAIRANLVALRHKPGAVELMDDKILKLTRENHEQRKNRFFIEGDPGAILIVEISGENQEEIKNKVQNLTEDLKKEGFGYHFPLVSGADISKVWALRKAGLGVLSNMKGDARPVSVIEDTSVNPVVLENYIDEFDRILEKYKLECVYHAHISVGELHLRPILNLKNEKDVALFREIAMDTARLVKKFKGSLSGEHGDGRLRGEFIPLMVGDRIYNWFKDIKNTWDPEGVFNSGKITDTPPMNTSLRYKPGVITHDIPTIFDFSEEGGIVRAAEKCNGSGDCRKSSLMGGTMCPSFMASRDENTSTRARANILREFLSVPQQDKPFDHREIYDVLDLCLSCKACKSECPSNVDIAKLKAEFLQHYYDEHGIPLRTRLIAYITLVNKLGSLFPGIFNFFVSQPFVSGMLKSILGFAKERSIPLLGKKTLRNWLRKELPVLNSQQPKDATLIYLFVDEFSNYNDVETGKKTVKLLSALGYRIIAPYHEESGRTYISKGLLRTARKKAIANIKVFSELINESSPLIGIEPSAILAFRDEYPDFFSGEMKKLAKTLGENALMAEEFLVREIESGHIKKESFTREEKRIKLHGHCQQKAVASTQSTKKLLSFPENYHVEEIPSGCCGMAGSFGYEKEHYELSMKVGEMVLFPAVRNAGKEEIIAAPGTSCRHQILDGTGKKALHPIEILYEALSDDPGVK